MMALLANGQKRLECNMCHYHTHLDDDTMLEIAADIHLCSGCRAYESQPVGFFTWFVLLERLYKAQGQQTVPRGGKYADDWPIRCYDRGLTPEKAFEFIETEVAA